MLYDVPEKAMAAKVAGTDNRVAYDDAQLLHSDSIIALVPWHFLQDVRNRSIQKTARYVDEKPMPSHLCRESVEETGRRFSVKYLVAVLNSSTIGLLLNKNRRSNVQLYPNDWKKLPVPDVPKDKQDPIVALVDQILDLKKKDPAADVSELEQKVDAMVGKLYGVAPAETAIAEERE